MPADMKQKHNPSLQEPHDLIVWERPENKLIITLQDVRSHAESRGRKHKGDTLSKKA